MSRPAWKFGLLTALTALACDVSFAAKPAPVKDFSRQVEVVVGGRLRETAKGQGELTLSLWNKSADAVAGPIFVVIDETGLEQVKVGSHSEETAKGKPVLKLVPAGRELLPGGMTPSFAVAFSMSAGLSRDVADTLHLETRVFGRQAPQVAEKLTRAREAREDADFATRGKNYNQAELTAAFAAQAAATPELMKKPDVLATAVTEDDKGNLAIQVYTLTRAAGKALPGSIDQYPVEIKPVPGGFKSGPTLSTVTTQNGVSTSKSTRTRNAQGTAARSGNSPNIVVPVDTTQRFDRPIPIGVSSFNAQTVDAQGVFVCASGTLGFRAKDSSGKLYAVSNSHVWGGLGSGTVGELIIQPSQGDNNCLTQTDVNTIGTLADFTSYINDVAGGPFFRSNTLPMNFIDAALMEVTDAADPTGALVPSVGFATPSDGYGAPSSNALRANRIGLQVQKHGRTTGYTRGYTSAVNVMATIAGDVANEDADYYRLDEFLGLPPFASLGAPGDSGSLIVTMDGRRPLALLFAGGSAGALGKTVTLGNQIGPVLDRFNVRVDDGTTAGVHTGGVPTTGISARGGLALGNLSRKDLADFQVVDAADVILNDLLPAELRGRVRPNQRPLIPTINGSGITP